MSKQYSFSNTPVIKHSRSRFDLSHRILTSGNVGTLYPFELQEVYPGDTFKVNTTVVSRLASSFIKPVMDNLFLDVYYFYVPSRLLFDKFVNVMGENTESAWANTQDYEVPAISGTVSLNTVGDRLGLPLGKIDKANILPIRAFAKIYEEWFRDENNIAPMHIQKGDNALNGEAFNNNDWAPNNYCGKLPKVAKMHDYFTSCVPAPQKGDGVNVPVIINGVEAPVVPVNDVLYEEELAELGGMIYPNVVYGLHNEAQPTGNPSLFLNNYTGWYTNLNVSQNDSGEEADIPDSLVTPRNLRAILNDEFTGSGIVGVNELRYAFAVQKLLERQAMSGSRFVEILASQWNVFCGDSRLQRSEFLGGKRIPINVQQVAQTTGYSSDGETPQTLAQLGAYSQSAGSTKWSKSFVEYGYVVGVFCVRQFHTYSQGVAKMWQRYKRDEFFNPVFSNIGYQPIMQYELFGAGTNAINNSGVFGYQEAWADLRQRPNLVTGQMRPQASDSYDVWHFADDYENAPVLGQTFIEETPEFVDRTIAVESTSADQFIFDFYVNNIAVRMLPTYSVPSLVDHN